MRLGDDIAAMAAALLDVPGETDEEVPLLGEIELFPVLIFIKEGCDILFAFSLSVGAVGNTTISKPKPSTTSKLRTFITRWLQWMSSFLAPSNGKDFSTSVIAPVIKGTIPSIKTDQD